MSCMHDHGPVQVGLGPGPAVPVCGKLEPRPDRTYTGLDPGPVMAGPGPVQALVPIQTSNF